MHPYHNVNLLEDYLHGLHLILRDSIWSILILSTTENTDYNASDLVILIDSNHFSQSQPLNTTGMKPKSSVGKMCVWAIIAHTHIKKIVHCNR